MFNRVDQLIDFQVFLQLRYTEMLLIYNSNSKLENVKAEVGQVAVRHSLLELESLSDFKIKSRSNDSLIHIGAHIDCLQNCHQFW